MSFFFIGTSEFTPLVISCTGLISASKIVELELDVAMIVVSRSSFRKRRVRSDALCHCKVL